MPLGLMELCYGSSSTVSCTQYRSKDWHARLGGGVHVEVIMGRTVHGAVWLKTGGTSTCATYTAGGTERTSAAPIHDTAGTVPLYESSWENGDFPVCTDEMNYYPSEHIHMSWDGLFEVGRIKKLASGESYRYKEQPEKEWGKEEDTPNILHK